MPRHVVTMIAVVAAFFVLLWFGVVALGLTGGEATLASFATLFLVGIGVTFTASTLRGERHDQE